MFWHGTMQRSFADTAASWNAAALVFSMNHANETSLLLFTASRSSAVLSSLLFLGCSAARFGIWLLCAQRFGGHNLAASNCQQLGQQTFQLSFSSVFAVRTTYLVQINHSCASRCHKWLNQQQRVGRFLSRWRWRCPSLSRESVVGKNLNKKCRISGWTIFLLEILPCSFGNSVSVTWCSPSLAALLNDHGVKCRKMFTLDFCRKMWCAFLNNEQCRKWCCDHE